ncbi:MAG: indolepyruvate oxidoreductase subunit beta [Anaerovibrio sp.]|uniref:indolepyruvate oxidoreductase subunit beta n=1 Tax=Anaerovibrio sp. TaxID=1872532 RepID=UPI0025D90731|nr:indolepyruvate oxidoreductase subunit beta [Anaerovibrio sp.]MCR5177009.1 indolepyruvate oxidoreductase subunit beta [Anaerovibrio sp.]
MNKNIVLCGVGGQGTVLASKLISGAAMNRGIPVKSAETIGMAQRGGSVFSHLRLGDNVDCPMIAKGAADIIIGFEPGEAVRMLPYLKRGGQVIVSSKPVMPVTAALAGSNYNGSEMLDYIKAKVDNVIVIDTPKACSDLGSTKVLNLLLLGAAVESGALGLCSEDIRQVIVSRIPSRFHELNFRALEYAKNVIDKGV